MPKKLLKITSKKGADSKKSSPTVTKNIVKSKRVVVPKSKASHESQESMNLAFSSKYKKYLNELCKKHSQKNDERFEKVRSMILDLTKSGGEKESFWVFDTTSIVDRIQIWRHTLPRIEVFYATKCNPDFEICKKVVSMDGGFDVASIKEMTDVVKLGANPENLIFANPVKQAKQLQCAKKLGIKKMTFDSIEELEKISKDFPEAECILRIATDTSTARYNLSEKFGAPINQIEQILKAATKLGLFVKGVAFHVGSGGVTFDAYQSSLVNARKVFDLAKKLGMKKMDFLDIGGGFTLTAHQQNEGKACLGKNFDEVAPKIGALVEKLFPDRAIRVIAEPGRYIAESACFLASRIIGKKVLDSGSHHYYVNNGIFTGYTQRLIGGEKQFVLAVDKSIDSRCKYTTTFWGQTCDSLDFILKEQQHPEYFTGEWIMTRDFGAYNRDLTSRFNGFEMPDVIYV